MATTAKNIAENSDGRPLVPGGLNEPLLVTGQQTGPAGGGQFWIASPADGSGPEQEVHIQIPPGATDRQQILKTLSSPGEMAKLCLLQGPTNRQYEVLHAGPALSDAQRAVHDEKGLAYTWTRELDERVDELFQHAIQARVFALQEKLLDDDKLFGPIAAQARDVFVTQMQACGDARTTHALGSLFDRGVDPALEGSKDSYAEAMMGRQLAGPGEVERVYYDASRPLSQQIEIPGEPTVRAAAVANYALQRSVFDYMHASICQTIEGPGATPVSFLECIEGELVRQRCLYGFHPSRTSDDYTRLTVQLSKPLVAATVQGAVCSMGGRAASAACDWVTPDGSASGCDEHGRPCTLQSYLYDKAYRDGRIIHYAEHERNHGKPRHYMKKLNAACQESADGHVAAKEAAVAAATDKAVASGRTRLSDLSKFIKNRLGDLALAKKGLISIFDDVEDTPPLIF
jgi:hypothetical protein